MQKAVEEARRGALVVALVPARTDTKWWHSAAPHASIRFLKGRLKFGDAKTSAPFPSALMIFKPQGQRLRPCPPSSPPWPEWFDIRTLSAYSQISERKLRELLRDDLPHVKVGRLVRVSRSAFDEWMKSKTAEQPAPLQLIRQSRPRRYSLLEDREGLRDDRAHDHHLLYIRRAT